MDVLVLNYNNWEETKSFTELISTFEIVEHVLIVDNCSTNDSFFELAKMSSDKVIVIKTNKNGGYGFGNNYGVSYLRKEFNSKYIAICNPDIIVEEETLSVAKTFLSSNIEYAIVAPWMQDQERNDLKCGWNISSWKKVLFGQLFLLGKKHGIKYAEKTTNDFVACDAVAGSLLIVDSNCFEEAGGYDENVFLYSEESILGLRMKKTFKKTALLCNHSFIHKGSTTISKEYKTSFSRHKMILKSQKYMFYKYYKLNVFDKIGISFFSTIILFETLLSNFFSNFKKKKR